MRTAFLTISLSAVLMAAGQAWCASYSQNAALLDNPPRDTRSGPLRRLQRPTVSDREKWAIRDAAQADDAARECLRGVLPDPVVGAARPDASAVLSKATADLGPFVSEGTEFWQVVFERINLAAAPVREPGEEHVRRVVCYLDPVHGKLLRIEIINDASDVVAPTEPDARAYRRQLAGVGPESWGSLAGRPPTVALGEALKVVQREMGGVGSAKMIVVHYVSWRFGPRLEIPDTDGGGFVNDWRDVWSIDLRGVPPFDATNQRIPVDARNHIRHVVDATSGAWLMASTVPQPEPKSPEPAPMPGVPAGSQ